MFILIPMEITNLRRVGAQSQPIANYVLIAINLVCYFLLSPAYWGVGAGSAPWTILTYGFVHLGWWHVLFNVWCLWVFGNPGCSWPNAPPHATPGCR